jgi:hypothetical protein
MSDDRKVDDDEELERQRAELLPLINPVPGDMPTDPPLVPMPGPRPPAEDTQ